MDNLQQTVTLSATASTLKRFAEVAQEQATFLALKVDELTLINEELMRQVAELTKGK